MASRTASPRAGRSCGSGISKRIPASRILVFTRTSRWLIVAGVTRKAVAILAASRPRTVCSISGVRAASSRAGWAQTKRSFSRSSGKTTDSRWARSATISSAVAAAAETFACRAASARRRRGASRGPVERPVEVGDLDDVVAAELLLGFGEGPILHVALAVLEPDRRGKGRRLEPGAADHHAGLGQGLRVSAVGAPVGVLSLLIGAGAEVGRGFIDQDCVLHGLPSLSRLSKYAFAHPLL